MTQLAVWIGAIAAAILLMIITVRSTTTPSTDETVVVTMYYAPWCPHCKRIKPEYDQLSMDGLTFESVDCVASPDACEGVKGYPTFRAHKNGVLLKEISGAPSGNLEEAVRQTFHQL